MISLVLLLIVMKLILIVLNLEQFHLVITLLRVQLVQDILLMFKSIKIILPRVFGKSKILNKIDLITLRVLLLVHLLVLIMDKLFKNSNLIDLHLSRMLMMIFAYSILIQVNFYH